MNVRVSFNVGRCYVIFTANYVMIYLGFTSFPFSFRNDLFVVKFHEKYTMKITYVASVARNRFSFAPGCSMLG